MKPLGDELPGMEHVSHAGRETAYRVVRGAADGPTVLYVHGSGGTHRVWAHQYAPSGPAHPAVAVDLSGHGDSTDVDAEPGPETLRAYAADVCAVARSTGASVLVGNSLGGAVTRRDFLTCHQFDVRDSLGALETPALAVVGEQDSLTPPSSHEYLAAHLPNCELAVIDDAAHLAMLDQPARFNTALGEFFGRLGLR